jgi:hypothetical protein
MRHLQGRRPCRAQSLYCANQPRPPRIFSSGARDFADRRNKAIAPYDPRFFSGRPEIEAHCASFNFVNPLICRVVSTKFHPSTTPALFTSGRTQLYLNPMPRVSDSARRGWCRRLVERPSAHGSWCDAPQPESIMIFTTEAQLARHVLVVPSEHGLLAVRNRPVPAREGVGRCRELARGQRTSPVDKPALRSRFRLRLLLAPCRRMVMMRTYGWHPNPTK